MVSWNELGCVSFYFLKQFVSSWQRFFLRCMIEFTSKAYKDLKFACGRFSTINLITLIDKVIQVI